MLQLHLMTRDFKKRIGVGFLIIGILRCSVFAENLNSARLDLETKPGITEEVEVYFSPRGTCQLQLIKELNNANNNIEVCMYYFTSEKLAETLINAKERGVKIRAYLDKSMRKYKHSQGPKLENAGILVKFQDHKGLMHNKFVVIDDKILITGSYNWTDKAEKQNDENIMIIRLPEAALLYKDKFEEYWSA